MNDNKIDTYRKIEEKIEDRCRAIGKISGLLYMETVHGELAFHCH